MAQNLYHGILIEVTTLITAIFSKFTPYYYACVIITAKIYLGIYFQPTAHLPKISALSVTKELLATKVREIFWNLQCPHVPYRSVRYFHYGILL